MASSCSTFSSTSSSTNRRLLSDLPRHRAAPATIADSALAGGVQRDNTSSKIYLATHEHTQPPANQLVTTEKQNILLRQFHARAESKRAQKRANSSEPTKLVEPAPKMPRRRAATNNADEES